MKKLSFVMIVVLALLVLSGCIKNETLQQEQYRNCTVACTGAISDNDPTNEDEEFTSLNYCQEECKKKYPKIGS